MCHNKPQKSTHRDAGGGGGGGSMAQVHRAF